MNAEPERSLSAVWIRATALGWLLGFVLVVVLAMVWDTIVGGAQFMVGVGMGAGVGYMQARVVKAWTGRIRPWFWTSTIGMGVPFLLWDVSSATGMQASYSLPLCVLLGGLLTGTFQHRLLRPRFSRTVWWIPACVSGWGLPAGLLALGDFGVLPTVGGALPAIVMLSGGLLLGAVTGKTLQWMSASDQSGQRVPTSGATGS